MVRNIALSAFAAHMLQRGIYATVFDHLTDADPVGFVCRRVVDLIEQGFLLPIEPSQYHVIDVGSDEWAQGAAVLVGYGIVSQAQADDIQSLSRRVPQWSIESVAAGYVIIVSDTGEREKISTVMSSDISPLIARKNEGI
jgi:hypothetical protein